MQLGVITNLILLVNAHAGPRYTTEGKTSLEPLNVPPHALAATACFLRDAKTFLTRFISPPVFSHLLSLSLIQILGMLKTYVPATNT